MKKFLTLVILVLACGTSFAQTPIYDSTQVYDTVTDTDISFYLFSTPKPCINPVSYHWAPFNVMVQQYVVPDTVTVYGVAIPLSRQLNSTLPIRDTVTGYRALLMKRTGHSPINTYAYSMELIDSISIQRSHTRFCWFLYENDCDEKQSLAAPCYEFYFDTPKQINLMTDTFYVGRYNPYTDSLACREFGGEYAPSLPGTLYQSADLDEPMYYDLFFPQTGYQDKKWGVFFPIIGFRCKPVRRYWLDSCTGTMASVSWSNEEPGALFDVRLVGDDGSDTTYVTSGNSLLLQNLSDSVRYNVMLRKQCHYCTSNYDTIARSEWLSYLSFGTAILPDTLVVLPSDTLIIGGDTIVNTGDTIVITPGEPIVIGGDTIFVNPGDSVIVNPGNPLSIRTNDILYRYTTLQPNPASDKVKVLSSFGISRIEAYDLKGRKVSEFRTPNSEFSITLDVSSWPRGTYLLRITTPAGPTTKKLLLR